MGTKPEGGDMDGIYVLTFGFVADDGPPLLTRLQTLLDRLPRRFGVRPLKFEPASPEITALLERLPEDPDLAARKLIADRGAVWARAVATRILDTLDARG